MEMISDRAIIEDEIDSILTSLESTLKELLGVVDQQKEKLRTPRKIDTPEGE